MNLTACGGLWCTQMSPDFVIRSAILHKYCDRIDVKSVSFLNANDRINHWNTSTPPSFLQDAIILRESSRRCKTTPSTDTGPTFLYGDSDTPPHLVKIWSVHHRESEMTSHRTG